MGGQPLPSHVILGDGKFRNCAQKIPWYAGLGYPSGSIIQASTDLPCDEFGGLMHQINRGEVSDPASVADGRYMSL